MPSDLEVAVESLVKVFNCHASTDGVSSTLSKQQLQQLAQNELTNFLKSQKDPAAVEKIMKDLDKNSDEKVDFEEFVSLVVKLTIACEQCYQVHLEKMGEQK